MITGIGIDLVEVKRMERWRLNSRLLQRYFHSDELASSGSCEKITAQFLAARFAAKEAFGKALGTGLTNIILKDIMVINTANGKPEMQVLGTAKEALKLSGTDKIHISLSHEKDYAIAMVILEKS